MRIPHTDAAFPRQVGCSHSPLLCPSQSSWRNRKRSCVNSSFWSTFSPWKHNRHVSMCMASQQGTPAKAHDSKLANGFGNEPLYRCWETQLIDSQGCGVHSANSKLCSLKPHPAMRTTRLQQSVAHSPSKPILQREIEGTSLIKHQAAGLNSACNHQTQDVSVPKQLNPIP